MIEARGLTKRFGQVVAVGGLTFSVRPGEGQDSWGATAPARPRRYG
jgi:ABC-type branched-subunit amino acid transport system ATPase component